VGRLPRWAVYLVASGVPTLFVFALHQFPSVSARALVPLLLLLVLVIARTWSTGPALAATICSTVTYAWFFLAPIGLSTGDLTDWIAFLSFAATAVVVGELSARAERRHLEAQEGRREIERLYNELQSAFDRASAAEAARRTEQTKAALLEALHHNLRTPLTSIKAAVTALIGAEERVGTIGLSRDSQEDLLAVIDEESDRLNRFIEGLSTAERHAPEGARLVSCSLDDVVKTSVSRAQTVTRGHRVEVALDEDLPRIAADSPSIVEVLYSLLDNASKYSPPNTTIRVQAKREDGPYIRVSVTDEGPGVPEEYRERVFEKFFRVPGREPHDSRRGGVGLGLPVARRLVESLGGRIWFEPKRDRGAAVAMTLPVAADASPARRVAAGVE
jgi:two-component system sensor histidine kinase KdpD